MLGISPILIGATVLLAAAAVGASAMLSPRGRAVSFYGQLVLMVGIYVGFAINGLEPIESANRADWSAFIIESLTALAFLFVGLAVLNSSKPWLLGALILAHGGVDVLHLALDAAHSPDWYEFLCVLYDAIVGFAAIMLLSDKPAESS